MSTATETAAYVTEEELACVSPPVNTGDADLDNARLRVWQQERARRYVGRRAPDLLEALALDTDEHLQAHLVGPVGHVN